MLSEIYQTLEYRNNNDYIEKEGPFQCTLSNAWLGEGFYFWDTFINYAHMWGINSYQSSGYVICKSIVDLNKFDVYDLESPRRLLEFGKIRDILKKQYPEERITASYVINYLKDKMPSFNFKAIRARGTSNSNFKNTDRYIRYVSTRQSYLDTLPQIQICILDKNIIGKNNFKIVYEEPSISHINI